MSANTQVRLRYRQSLSSVLADGLASEVLDAVLDYPAFYPLTAAFGNTSGDLSALTQTVQKEQSAYRLGTAMTGSFLENQDNPRFQSFQTDQAVRIPVSLRRWGSSTSRKTDGFWYASWC